VKKDPRDIFESYIAKKLLEKRQEKEWGIVHLSNISQVQTPVINNAERGLSSPTLLTIVVLFYFLGIDIEDFLHECGVDINLPQSYKGNCSSEDALGIQDIELFLSYNGSDAILGIKELSRYYARVIIGTHPETINSEEIMQQSKEWVAKSLNPPAMSPQKIDLDPDNIEPREFENILNKGGVLLLPDCGLYLSTIRKRSKISRLALQPMTSVSDSTISRLETGEITRIRFADIVSIDAALAASGKIIAMFWCAALLHTGLIRNKYYDIPKKHGPLAWTQSEWPVVETLVKMDRQMRSVIHNNGSWVFEFRQTLGNWKQSHPSPAEDAGLPKHILWRLDPREHLAEIIFRCLKTPTFDLARPARFIPNSHMRLDIEVWNQFVNLYRDNPEALRIMEKGSHYLATPEEQDAFRKLIIEVLGDSEQRENFGEMLIKRTDTD